MNPKIKRQVDAFFGDYPTRQFHKGEILIFAGEAPSGIFYLRQGNVRQYDILSSGDEAVVNVFKPPAFFPMNYVINRRQNDYFFDAATYTTAHVAPVDDVYNFVRQSTDVLFDLLARVYNGVDGVLRRQVYLMDGKSHSRLLYELILSCERIGERQSNGSYLVGLSESELAVRSGLSRETVNRRLQELKRQNLVQIKANGLLVGDVAALEKMLDAAR